MGKEFGSPVVAGGSIVQFPGHGQVLDDALDLLDVLVADALAAAVAALEAVEDVLPHGPGGLQTARPVAAALQLPLETPLAGEVFGAEEAALPGFRVLVGPLDLDGHVSVSPCAGGPGRPPGRAAAASTSAARRR